MKEQLSSAQRKFLKGLAHSLDPAVTLGKQGLTDSLLKEVKRQLSDRELIKIRIEQEERDERRDLAEVISVESDSHLVNIIGKIAILFRPHPEEPVIKLPKR